MRTVERAPTTSSDLAIEQWSADQPPRGSSRPVMRTGASMRIIIAGFASSKPAWYGLAMSLQSQVAPSPVVVLLDGTAVDVRPLEPVDRDCFAAGVARLSARSLYLRFASPKPRLTERDLDALLDLDHHGREALLAVDPLCGVGVGVGRFAELRDEPGVVDVAVTVIDDW